MRPVRYPPIQSRVVLCRFLRALCLYVLGRNFELVRFPASTRSAGSYAVITPTMTTSCAALSLAIAAAIAITTVSVLCVVADSAMLLLLLLWAALSLASAVVATMVCGMCAVDVVSGCLRRIWPAHIIRKPRPGRSSSFVRVRQRTATAALLRVPADGLVGRGSGHI